MFYSREFWTIDWLSRLGFESEFVRNVYVVSLECVRRMYPGSPTICLFICIFTTNIFSILLKTYIFLRNATYSIPFVAICQKTKSAIPGRMRQKRLFLLSDEHLLFEIINFQVSSHTFPFFIKSLYHSKKSLSPCRGYTFPPVGGVIICYYRLAIC